MVTRRGMAENERKKTFAGSAFGMRSRWGKKQHGRQLLCRSKRWVDREIHPIGENTMSAVKVYLACFGGVIAFLALCSAVMLRSAIAGWLFAALAPALLVFVWWSVDRAALERRITRLEARSEIADERRVVTQSDLTDVEHKLQEIEIRVADAVNFVLPQNFIKADHQAGGFLVKER